MTLQKYYEELNKIEVPESLSFLEKREWYRKERKKLQDLLSESDLEIVHHRQCEWQKKLQSSHL